MNYIDLFFSYRKIIFQVLFYEIFFSLKYREFKPRIKIQNNNFITDTIPCIYYFLFNISKFIKKNNIQSVVDLGSGFGRIINFINNENKIKSIGIEIDKDVYRQSIQLKSEKVKIYNNDILKIDLSKFKSECFILNDPLKKEKNKKKLRNKIKKLKKKNNKIYVITININKKFPQNDFNLITKIEGSEKKNLYFYEVI